MRFLDTACVIVGLAFTSACGIERGCSDHGQCDLGAQGLCLAGQCAYAEGACASGLSHSPLAEQDGCLGGPAVAEVHLDTEIGFQTMEGIGATTFVYAIGEDEGYDWATTAALFVDLELDAIRMRSWFGWWEPVNDNDDPYLFGDFETEAPHISRDDLPFGQWAAGEGVEVFSVHEGISPWMCPGGSLDRVEYAESVVSYTRFLQDGGVAIRQAELLPGDGSDHLDTPEDAAQMYAAVWDYFSNLGHGEVHLVGPARVEHDDHRPHVAAMLSSGWPPGAIDAVTYKHWGHPPASTLTGLSEIASENALPVWAVEVGSCGSTGTCPDNLDPVETDWADALDMALGLTEALTLGNATRAYAAFLVPNMVHADGGVSGSYWALAHVSRYVESGSLRIGAEVQMGVDGITVMAFTDLDGSHRLIAINQSDRPRRLRTRSNGGETLAVEEATQSCARSRFKPAEVEGGALIELGGSCILSARLR